MNMKKILIINGPNLNLLGDREKKFYGDTSLEKIKSLDFGFLDGNHQEKPTIEYFEECLKYCHHDSVLIFDDIHWSDGMENAWNYIKNHDKVFVSIDLFFVGIVFLNPNQRKEHFVIRY